MSKGNQHSKHKKHVSDNGLRHRLLVQTISQYASQTFRSQHLLIEGDPQYADHERTIAERDVPTSTAITGTRETINQLVRMVKTWNKPNATQPETGRVYATPCSFSVFEWGEDGKKVEKEAYISYSMVKDDNTSRWILHHLQGTIEPDKTNFTKGQYLHETYDSSDYEALESSNSD